MTDQGFDVERTTQSKFYRNDFVFCQSCISSQFGQHPCLTDVMTDESKVDQWSLEPWLEKYHVLHLKSLLLESIPNVNSREKCIELAAGNVEDDIKPLLKRCDNNHNLKSEDLINLEHAFNSLLKLKQTEDFLSKLNQLSQLTPTTETKKWALTLMDCDDIRSLLNENKVTLEDVQNSINVLQASIYRLIENSSNHNIPKNEIFGYHLGGDLFFIC